jgi:hypothetical protein
MYKNAKELRVKYTLAFKFEFPTLFGDFANRCSAG